jgi:hypothetical protein
MRHTVFSPSERSATAAIIDAMKEISAKGDGLDDSFPFVIYGGEKRARGGDRCDEADFHNSGGGSVIAH